MKTIGNFFSKYAEMLRSGGATRDAVREVAGKILGRELAQNEIELTKGIVSFKVSPIQKQELFMHKESILRDIQEKIPEARITGFK